MEPPTQESNLAPEPPRWLQPSLVSALCFATLGFCFLPTQLPARWPPGFPPTLLGPPGMVRLLIAIGLFLGLLGLYLSFKRTEARWQLYPGFALVTGPFSFGPRPLRKSELEVVAEGPRMIRLADVRRWPALARWLSVPVPLADSAARARFLRWLQSADEAVELVAPSHSGAALLLAAPLLALTPAAIAYARFSRPRTNWATDPCQDLVLALALAGAAGALGLSFGLWRGRQRRVLMTPRLFAFGHQVWRRRMVERLSVGGGVLEARVARTAAPSRTLRLPAPGLSAARLRQLVGESVEVRERPPDRRRRLALLGGALLLAGCACLAWLDLGYLDVVHPRMDAHRQVAWLVVRTCDREPRALVVVAQGARSRRGPRLALPQASWWGLLWGSSPPAKLWLPEAGGSVSVPVDRQELVVSDPYRVLLRRPGPFPPGLGDLITAERWVAPLTGRLGDLYPAEQGPPLTSYLEGRVGARVFQFRGPGYRMTWVAEGGQVGPLLIAPARYPHWPRALRGPGPSARTRLRLGEEEVGPGEAAHFLGGGSVVRAPLEAGFEELLAAAKRIERGKSDVQDELAPLVPALFR